MAQASARSTEPPAEALLAWYDRGQRRFAWRGPRDPYVVWLSEIMLQQTTTAAVAPYFERFLARFPDVHALARAPAPEVMAAWAGLGYYARARNLHACAQAVSAAGGAFPATVAGLEALPGIGPYTARAIGAIAFGIPVVPVDGNVERIVARLFAIETALPAAKPALAQAAQRLGADPAARARPGDFAQALFDLGATICTRRPACALCPWWTACRGRAAGIAGELPRKAPRKARPVRHGVHFRLTDAAGQVLLRRRPETGLFGGMSELPGTAWRAAPWSETEALAAAPMPAPWRHAGQVRHGLTHMELHLEVYAATVPRITAEGYVRPLREADREALPTVMRKCLRLA